MLWKVILNNSGCSRRCVSTSLLHSRGEITSQHHGMALPLTHKTESRKVRVRKRKFSPQPHPPHLTESGVGEGILIELATLDNFTYPGDLFPSNFHSRQDVADPEVILSDLCTYTPSKVPGIPFKPVMERIKAVTLHSNVIKKL